MLRASQLLPVVWSSLAKMWLYAGTRDAYMCRDSGSVYAEAKSVGCWGLE